MIAGLNAVLNAESNYPIQDVDRYQPDYEGSHHEFEDSRRAARRESAASEHKDPALPLSRGSRTSPPVLPLTRP